MANKPLKSIKFPGLPDTYTIPQVDAVPTQGSTNAVSSGGVYDEITGLKEDLSDPENFSGATLTDSLFNPERGEKGVYLDVSTGDTHVNADYCVSDYIQVTATNWYFANNIGRYVFYDENKRRISGSSSILATSAPEGAAYLRVDLPIANLNVAGIREGRFRHLPEQVEFKVQYPWLDIGKVAASNMKDAIFVNAFNKEKAIDGYYVNNNNGAREASEVYFASEYIPVKPNTSYTINYGARYACYDSDKQYLSGENLSGLNKQIITPNDAAYIIICGTPLSRKDTLVFAETEYYTTTYEPYSVIVPWLKANAKKSKYDGEILVCFGDSITNYGYTDTIKADTGLKAINVGLSSGRYAYSDDSNQYVNAFAFHNIVDAINTGDWTIPDSLNGVSGYETQYAHIQDIKAIDFSKVQFVSIAYGTNDFASATPLDDENDPLNPNKSFKGAIRYCLKGLTEKYPHLKILGVTPCYRFWSESGNVLYDSDTHAVGGMFMTQYVQAVEDVYTEYHLPFVNNYDNAGINKYNRLQYFGINDGLHPNAKGREIIGHRIASGIINNY